MTKSNVRVQKKLLKLERETLKQLDDGALVQVVGGNFNPTYKTYCLGACAFA